MGVSKNDRKRSRADDISPDAIEARDNGTVQSSKRARVEERRSLFVRSLPPNVTSESLTEYFSEHFPVKHATVVVDQQTKESRGFGFVTFADAEDAQTAKNTLDKQEWGGRRIRLEVAEPRHRNASSGPSQPIPGKPIKDEVYKLPKLIVRNLPWSIKTPQQLEHLFRSFGKVKYADLPRDKGKMKGFGFVTIRGKQNAERALEAINGKEIDGRMLAVDWAVDKQTWDQQQPQDAKAEAKEDDEDADEDADEEMEDGDEPEKNQDGPKPRGDDQLDEDLRNFMKNHMGQLEDESDEDEDKKADGKSIEKQDKQPQQKAPVKRLTTDNSSTVFVRNLPFTSNNAQLKEFFEHFGKVRYARVVMDRVSEKPAGTAFVCFFNAEDAKNCIKGAPRPQLQQVSAAKSSVLQDESADPGGRYTLDGRLLSVAQAVNKDEASNMAENSLAKRREKDKRRLYLLSEGSVPSNSPLYNLFTPAEIAMRQASANQRKKMVQTNPSLHLSLTRLALRNIPRNVDSKDLKELARKAVVGFAMDVKEGRRQPLSKEENARDSKEVKDKERERKAKGKGIIRQAKVVFESTSGSKISDKSGGGRSRGYGFIEYASHHWALMGLRYLNGMALENDAGKKQHLIVEFAIENAQVIHRRQALEEKARQQQQEQVKNGGAKNGKDQEEDDEEEAQSSDEGGKGKSKEEDMKQRLIGRKRLMKKKKAKARG